MTVRPTRGVLLALVLALVLHQLARITDGGWLALAAAACAALPVVALVLRPRLDGVRVHSEPVRARVGQEVEQRLTIRNDSTRWSPVLRLTDSTPGLSRAVLAVPALPPAGSVTAVLPRRAEARGWCSAAELALESTAPLGLLRVRRSVPVAGPFAVAPRPATARRSAEAGAGRSGSSRPVAGTGTEVLGLRAWRPGDGAAAVSARATARHARPVVLERERESGSALVLLCAATGAGHEWERAVEQSCALAEDALRRGQAPRLVAAGLPEHGGDVLGWHARLDAAGPADGRTVTSAVQAAGLGGALVLLAPPAADVSAVVAACTRARIALTVLRGE